MGTLYNRITGQSIGRLAALSDGVFAIAMTLLVLDLRVPDNTAVHSAHDVLRVLLTLSPRFIPYFMTFMTLGMPVGNTVTVRSYSPQTYCPRLVKLWNAGLSWLSCSTRSAHCCASLTRTGASHSSCCCN